MLELFSMTVAFLFSIFLSSHRFPEFWLEIHNWFFLSLRSYWPIQCKFFLAEYFDQTPIRMDLTENRTSGDLLNHIQVCTTYTVSNGICVSFSNVLLILLILRWFATKFDKFAWYFKYIINVHNILKLAINVIFHQ